VKSEGGSGLGAAGEALAAGILLPLCVVGGYLLGRWTGRAFGLTDVLGYGGGALGAVAGFWNLFRIGNRSSSSGKSGD
jgi:hypothetical protein